jgi:hypothetical protein
MRGLCFICNTPSAVMASSVLHRPVESAAISGHSASASLRGRNMIRPSIRPRLISVIDRRTFIGAGAAAMIAAPLAASAQTGTTVRRIG